MAQNLGARQALGKKFKGEDDARRLLERLKKKN
jgi:hypothetical protein